MSLARAGGSTAPREAAQALRALAAALRATRAQSAEVAEMSDLVAREDDARLALTRLEASIGSGPPPRLVVRSEGCRGCTLGQLRRDIMLSIVGARELDEHASTITAWARRLGCDMGEAESVAPPAIAPPAMPVGDDRVTDIMTARALKLMTSGERAALNRLKDVMTTMTVTVRGMRARHPGLDWRQMIDVLVAIVVASDVDPLAVAAHLETIGAELREPS